MVIKSVSFNINFIQTTRAQILSLSKGYDIINRFLKQQKKSMAFGPHFFLFFYLKRICLRQHNPSYDLDNLQPVIEQLPHHCIHCKAIDSHFHISYLSQNQNFLVVYHIKTGDDNDSTQRILIIIFCSTCLKLIGIILKDKHVGEDK